jgi:DNA-nicking Smr family endonuclease
MDDFPSREDPIVIPIEDFLDLHAFRPGEVRDLLDDYLEEAWKKGFREVRIIHGKGTGMLRSRVQGILAQHPLVLTYREADTRDGGWGATVAVLKEKPTG